MRSAAIVALVALSFQSLSCGPGTCVDLQEVSYKVWRTDDLVRDKEAKVVLTVTNKSDLFMLVKSVTGPHISGDAGTSLVSSEAGTLAKDEKSGSYRHDPTASGETPSAFAWGLVPPGAKLDIEVAVKPGTEDAAFTAHYIGLAAEEVSRWIYFAGNGAQDGAKRTYATLTERQVEELTDAQTREAAGVSCDKVVLHERLLRADARCDAEMPYRFVLK